MFVDYKNHLIKGDINRVLSVEVQKMLNPEQKLQHQKLVDAIVHADKYELITIRATRDEKKLLEKISLLSHVSVSKLMKGALQSVFEEYSHIKLGEDMSPVKLDEIQLEHM